MKPTTRRTIIAGAAAMPLLPVAALAVPVTLPLLQISALAMPVDPVVTAFAAGPRPPSQSSGSGTTYREQLN